MTDLSTAMSLLYTEGDVSRYSIYRVTGVTTAGDSIVLTSAFSKVNGGSQIEALATSTADYAGCVPSGTTLNLSTVAVAQTVLVFVWGLSA